MSNSATTSVASDRPAWRARVADFWELTKPRIVAMEIITIAMGFYLAAGSEWSPAVLVATLVGTGMIAGSASTLNQWLERDLDALMSRTANRPLPAGRIEPWQAITFGLALLAGGTVLLYAGPGGNTLVLGILCWCLYVVAYTPLKTCSTLNTAVGAASGAIPIVMGWAATGNEFNVVTMALFGVLYLWQYPHFMAIAWRCRDDYLKAGYVMATTVDPSGRRAGIEAIVGSLLLIPVILVPVAMSTSAAAAAVYVIWSLILAGMYLWVSIAFARNPSDRTSRRLLLVSLFYLPCWILGLFFVAV